MEIAARAGYRSLKKNKVCADDKVVVYTLLYSFLLYCSLSGYRSGDNYAGGTGPYHKISINS
jgi:hypothetical protein